MPTRQFNVRTIPETMKLREATGAQSRARFADFVRAATDESGEYSPFKAVFNLLTAIASDPRALIIASMRPNAGFRSAKDIYKDAVAWAERFGVPAKQFPITREGVGAYLRNPKRRNGNNSEGVLVRLGVVEARMGKTEWRDTWTYRLTPAGAELYRAAALLGMRFVGEARRGLNAHRHDSLLMVLSDKSRPAGVFGIVKQLSDGRAATEAEIGRSLGKENFKTCSVSVYLQSLGESGVIDYSSVHTDSEVRKGALEYRVGRVGGLAQSDDQLFASVQRLSGRYMSHVLFYRVMDYVMEHLNDVILIDDVRRYVLGKREEGSRMSPRGHGVRSEIGVYLGHLARLGVLDEIHGRTNRTRSSARANKMTLLLYERLFEPLERLALTLNPTNIELPQVDSQIVGEFLRNYKEESAYIPTRKTKTDGAREKLREMMALKRRRISTRTAAKFVSDALGREISPGTVVQGYLRPMRNEGIVEYLHPGYWRHARTVRSDPSTPQQLLRSQPDVQA